ncbi:MAG: UvrD-helicase domain-containing protein [Polyangiaceae bacterium]|nr:UvrD-helicase domain-containing protein [Polyangiaceae bacterium]
MSDGWLLTIKPSFLHELVALPAKEAAQVQKKLESLTADPRPDAKVKKQLKHLDGRLHRLRSGDFRIFYTFDERYVSVLSLRKRDEQTYSEIPEAESLGGGDVSGIQDPPEVRNDVGAWLETSTTLRPKPLPRPITVELLDALRVPPEHHARLLAVQTEDQLLDCADVPEKILERVLDGVVGRPLDDIARQPDLVVESPDDLLRYRQGELLGFLLRLNPEQEKLVTWSLAARGPTLLKGGPGTGKSTVALHRVKIVLDALRKTAVERPRILFTTYTNALVRYSEQLLRSLLGDDAGCVEVRTADSVAIGIARAAGEDPHILDGGELRALAERALREVELQGNSLAQKAQRATLDRLGVEYVTEEVLDVIDGRGLGSLDEYQSAARPGRQLPLNRTQREAVWRVHAKLHELLDASHRTTWADVRLHAVQALTEGRVNERYDAVLIDEAQDLSPSALEVLVRSCREPNRLFLTADANQSIYGGGFRWSNVHEWLKFQGRTGVLRANHRSTREIGEAAESYLAGGALDPEREEPAYVHAGPLPAVRAVASAYDETQLLARFFRGAARDLRLGLSACAVLCPTNTAAQRVASELNGLGIAVRYMAAKDLDVGAAEVKTLTLKSAKGLEFPIVALAGFLDGPFPMVPKGATDEVLKEIEERERRTLYVAMSRAMRALLIVEPAERKSTLLAGFDSTRWNLGVTS